MGVGRYLVEDPAVGPVLIEVVWEGCAPPAEQGALLDSLPGRLPVGEPGDAESESLGGGARRVGRDLRAALELKAREAAGGPRAGTTVRCQAQVQEERGRLPPEGEGHEGPLPLPLAALGPCCDHLSRSAGAGRPASLAQGGHDREGRDLAILPVLPPALDARLGLGFGP